MIFALFKIFYSIETHVKKIKPKTTKKQLLKKKNGSTRTNDKIKII